MATTTNFGWTTPDDTGLVKDGALAIRTLGSAIDTSLVDLKGGTTGQILSKASNTDLDFTWSSDATGIQATIFDAKGDLIAASAADTAARLAVGTNGQVLTADSTAATGLKWATPTSGGMTQLATGSLTGTTVTISSISGSYRDLRLVIRDYVPVNDAALIMMRINGSTTGYSQTATNATNQSFASSSADISGSNDNSVANSLTIVEILDYANTDTWKWWRASSLTVNSTTTSNWDWGVRYGFNNTTSAIDSITLLNSTGNFSSGTYILYGVQ